MLVYRLYHLDSCTYILISSLLTINALFQACVCNCIVDYRAGHIYLIISNIVLNWITTKRIQEFLIKTRILISIKLLSKLVLVYLLLSNYTKTRQFIVCLVRNEMLFLTKSLGKVKYYFYFHNWLPRRIKHILNQSLN